MQTPAQGVALRQRAEQAIIDLLERKQHPLPLGKVLRETRDRAVVDEGTARRAVLRLAASGKAVLDSALNISLSQNR